MTAAVAAWRCGPRNDILFAWHNVPMPYPRVAEVAAR